MESRVSFYLAGQAELKKMLFVATLHALLTVTFLLMIPIFRHAETFLILPYGFCFGLTWYVEKYSKLRRFGCLISFLPGLYIGHLISKDFTGCFFASCYSPGEEIPILMKSFMIFFFGLSSSILGALMVNGKSDSI